MLMNFSSSKTGWKYCCWNISRDNFLGSILQFGVLGVILSNFYTKLGVMVTWQKLSFTPLIQPFGTVLVPIME
jgi:hypothetical protein